MGAIEEIVDNYSQGQMIGIGVAFTMLPIIAVALRLWAKFLGQKGIKLDDYLVIAAMTVAIGCASVQLVAAVDGQLGQHQSTTPDGQPILDDPRFVIYEKCKLAVNILSTVGLGLVKSSILVFYMNIFFGRPFEIASKVVLCLVIGWTVSFFFANLFTCYPITPFIEFFYHNDCVDGLALWYAMAISDIIIDVIILIMPIPMVLKLHLPWTQKLGVLAMFLLGTIVCAFSLTRALIYVHVGESLEHHYNDETYYTSPVFFWAVIELSTAILSACLPTYRPIWLLLRGRPIRPRNRSSYYARNHGSSGLGSSKREYPLGPGMDFKDDIRLTDGLRMMDVEINAQSNRSDEQLPSNHGITVERSVHMGSQPVETI
ncbi:MFS transporter, FHS family, L-fucose permease [Daldinia childiae]|uniref:MFS transporter, FHS family, L-fucose permease n=1 Tax=Daldinia childiae TaxID=326645 RepID=UPI001446E877|nr:MFS transporter, FHS family, L-fucose permease [Daldinia childiae]KAF3071140.1 MFS transporter, FHS family, L-fucose permease [Daldinia childiae]